MGEILKDTGAELLDLVARAKYLELCDAASKLCAVLISVGEWIQDVPPRAISDAKAAQIEAAILDAVTDLNSFVGQIINGVTIDECINLARGVVPGPRRVETLLRKAAGAIDPNDNHALELSAFGASIQHSISGFLIHQSRVVRLSHDGKVKSVSRATARTQRWRNRKRAGFQMVTIPVHKDDYDLLARYGLITDAKNPDRGELEDAAHAIYVAGIVADPNDNGGVTLAEFAGAKPDLNRRRDAWFNRITDFMESALPSIKKDT